MDFHIENRSETHTKCTLSDTMSSKHPPSKGINSLLNIGILFRILLLNLKNVDHFSMQ